MCFTCKSQTSNVKVERNKSLSALMCVNWRVERRYLLVFNEDSNDEGSNFILLLKLREKDVPDLMEWIKREIHKFTRHCIQNEILVIVSNQITRTLSKSPK